MYDAAEATITMYATKKPSLAASAALSLLMAKNAARICNYALPDQTQQFNRRATKAKQRLMKKIYLLVD